MGLSGKVAALVGYDLGGAVATGFAARYPHLCISLTLLSPIGVKYKSPLNEKSFQSKYFGEISMAKQKTQIPEMQEVDFFNVEADGPHRYLVDRQIAMAHWQIKNTPGYLGALLSSYRNFPIRNMDELFAAVGRHSRKVLVIWGNKDKVCFFIFLILFYRCVHILSNSDCRFAHTISVLLQWRNLSQMVQLWTFWTAVIIVFSRNSKMS